MPYCNIFITNPNQCFYFFIYLNMSFILLKRKFLEFIFSARHGNYQFGFDPASASSRMNHYEKGRHVPDIDTIRRMAAELNVPLNYFFCDDQTTAELALLISRMTEEERSSLIEALKTSSGVKHADKK